MSLWWTLVIISIMWQSNVSAVNWLRIWRRMTGRTDEISLELLECFEKFQNSTGAFFPIKTKVSHKSRPPRRTYATHYNTDLGNRGSNSQPPQGAQHVNKSVAIIYPLHKHSRIPIPNIVSRWKFFSSKFLSGEDRQGLFIVREPRLEKKTKKNAVCTYEIREFAESAPVSPSNRERENYSITTRHYVTPLCVRGQRLSRWRVNIRPTK